MANQVLTVNISEEVRDLWAAGYESVQKPLTLSMPIGVL